MPTVSEENRELRAKVAQLEQALGRATFELSQALPGARLRAGKCPELVAGVTVSNPQDAIEFYSDVLGGRELFRVHDRDARIPHAAVSIGDSVLFINSEYPEVGRVAPQRAGGSAVVLNFYVPDAKATFDRAIKAGCKQVSPVKETFWGDVSGTLTDPFGHQLVVATNQEPLSPAEIMRRAERELGPQPKR